MRLPLRLFALVALAGCTSPVDGGEEVPFTPATMECASGTWSRPTGDCIRCEMFPSPECEQDDCYERQSVILRPDGLIVHFDVRRSDDLNTYSPAYYCPILDNLESWRIDEPGEFERLRRDEVVRALNMECGGDRLRYGTAIWTRATPGLTQFGDIALGAEDCTSVTLPP